MTALFEAPGEASSPSSGGSHVLLIDDHRLLSQALAMALNAQGLVADVPIISDRATLLAQVADAQPELVLLDLELGVLGNGLDLLPALVQGGYRVLVVSATTSPEPLCRALDLGAVGVVSKGLPLADLLQAVLAAVTGREVMPPSQRVRLRQHCEAQRAARTGHLAPFQHLSFSEQQVLRALADGHNVAAISRERFVSEATVRSQVRAVLTKLQVGSQLEAVAMARRAGWL